MSMDRRHFSGLLAGLVGSAALPPSARPATLAATQADPCHLPETIRALRPMTDGVSPISAVERAARVGRAQEHMAKEGLGAVLLEGGTSMAYFTGVRWGLSERTFAVVLPAKGEPIWICPGFEEARARESIGGTAEVRAWQEDESPYRLIAQALRDRGVRTGKVGVEERVRFFIVDGTRRELPGVEFTSADAVTAGCRMIKSPAELALLQRANDITTAAFRAVVPTLAVGMSQGEVATSFTAAHERLGAGESWALVLFGESSAFPHGTTRPARLKEGDIVLMDVGGSFQGYQSDVTRTTVFGKPTQRQRDIWDLEKRAQDAALAAAQPGATCASVDAAARAVIEKAGFGPGYKVPGLPHRTGHGIGMDGHEWTNFVKGNTARIQPGMCFSDEPTIAIYGEFGIRLEDCLYVAEQGPKFFTAASPSIEQPFPA
jgi:Xaa-Pro dipeptidase